MYIQEQIRFLFLFFYPFPVGWMEYAISFCMDTYDKSLVILIQEQKKLFSFPFLWVGRKGVCYMLLVIDVRRPGLCLKRAAVFMKTTGLCTTVRKQVEVIKTNI